MTAIGAISVKQSDLNKTRDPVLDRCPELLFLSFIDYWHLDEKFSIKRRGGCEVVASEYFIHMALALWPYYKRYCDTTLASKKYQVSDEPIV